MQITLAHNPIKANSGRLPGAYSHSSHETTEPGLMTEADRFEKSHDHLGEASIADLRRWALRSGFAPSFGGAPGQGVGAGKIGGGGGGGSVGSVQLQKLGAANKAGRALNKQEQATFDDALGLLNGLGGRYSKIAKELKQMDAQGLVRNDSEWVQARGGNAETIRDSKNAHYGINLSDVLFASDPVLKKKSKTEDLDRFSKAAQLAAVLAHEHKHFEDSNRYYSTKSCERPGWSEEMAFWNQLVIQTRATRSPEVCDIALRLAQGREDEGIALDYLDHRRVYRP